MYTFDELRQAQQKIFTDILPQHGFSPRGKQIDLAGKILSAMRGKNIFLAEAEVGTGKTLAYLLPAVLTRRSGNNRAPIAVATSSIALQKAIVRDYIPKLSDVCCVGNSIYTQLQWRTG
jgi:ATP-dependent DNA helicase DinG